MHHNILVFGDLTINKSLRQAFIKGQKIRLRRKEYDLLEFLVDNRERVLNRLTILEYVWNYRSHLVTNTLEVHINSLRKKIDQHGDRSIIKTVHGIGYTATLSFSPDPRQMVIPFETDE